LDTIGKRYNLLPTEVLERATTFDLQVLDIALSYEVMKQKQARGELPEIKQEDLLKAVEQIRGASNVG
jgi:hypothetical protein